MINDIINGIFRLIVTPFILLSVRKLLKDKQVKGVCWMHISLFAVWGYWGLYYFSSLNQWWSFAGECLVVVANTFYAITLIYYSFSSKYKEKI